MQFTGAVKNPAGHIKQGKYGMKHKKENIDKLVPHVAVVINHSPGKAAESG